MDNLIQPLPAEGLYFEMLIVWSMIELIIQPKYSSKYFCMFGLIVVNRLIETHCQCHCIDWITLTTIDYSL